MTSHRNARAFTLLELLVATAMMAMIMAAAFATLRIAFRARDTALSAVAPVRTGETALEIIRRDLESALPPTGRLASTFLGAPGTEIADTSGVVFSTVGNPAPGYVESVASTGGGGGLTVGSGSGGGGLLDSSDATLAGGMLRVAYAVRQTNSGSRVLVRQVQRNLLAQVESSEADEESIVCRGVRTFLLRYYDGSQWLEDWDSTQLGNALPMAVEVTLELDRPPAAGTALGPTAAELQPYTATRILFLACYDAAAAQSAGGAP